MLLCKNESAFSVNPIAWILFKQPHLYDEQAGLRQE